MTEGLAVCRGAASPDEQPITAPSADSLKVAASAVVNRGSRGAGGGKLHDRASTLIKSLSPIARHG